MHRDAVQVFAHAAPALVLHTRERTVNDMRGGSYLHTAYVLFGERQVIIDT